MASSESVHDSDDFDSESDDVFDEPEDSDEDKFEQDNSDLLAQLQEEEEEDSSELREHNSNEDSDFKNENELSDQVTNITKEETQQCNSIDSTDISLEKSSGISLDKTGEARKEIDLMKESESSISLEKLTEDENNPKSTISLDKEDPSNSVKGKEDSENAEEPKSSISLEKINEEDEEKTISLDKEDQSDSTKTEEETKNTEDKETNKEDEETESTATKKNERITATKSATPHLSDMKDQSSSLREKLRSQNINKKDFVKINLESLSAIAVADIKRSSMSSTAIIDIEIAKAKGLHPVKSGPPSPMCLLAIRKDTNKDHEKKIELKKAHEQTSVLPKNSSPVWNEKKELKLDQVKGESQRWLVLEIRDKSPKGEFLGYIEVNLNNIADLVQREEWFTLQKRKKKDKVSGEILLRTCVRPERKVEPVIAIKGENFPAIPSFIYNSFWNQHCVTKVAITHCGIGSIPEGMFALGSLEVLQLSDNNIAVVPKTLGRIFTLKFLDLSNNRIAKLPKELSNLKNLQGLEIQGNKFDEQSVPDCIVDLDLWCDINGKPDSWDQLIEEELVKRESQEQQNDSVTDKAVMDEKEKEIQRLLQNMK